MNDFTVVQEGGQFTIQAHAMSHPTAIGDAGMLKAQRQYELWQSLRDSEQCRDCFERERDQLRAELAAAQRAQMMLQAVNADLHRQLRERGNVGRDEGVCNKRMASEATSDAGRMAAASPPVGQSMGAVLSLASATSEVASAERRLGRGNGALDEIG